MLRIREEQMRALEQVASGERLTAMALHLQSKFGDRLTVSPDVLRHAISTWIADAKKWGLRSNQSITRYVESCAATQGAAEPLDVRLTAYLRLHYGILLAGLNVSDFVRNTLAFASRYGVKEEEGIVWLSVILLSGRKSKNFEINWIQDILNKRNLDEEARLRLVHREAQIRGWSQPEERSK